MKITDQSQMPFGKYKGVVMERVPAEYLLWWWDEAHGHDRKWLEQRLEKAQRQSGQECRHEQNRLALHEYIRDNFNALETEAKDRIVQHRP